MIDLIDRQEAIKALCMAGCDSGHCGVSCPDVMAIEHLPSAVVRCKDCRYGHRFFDVINGTTDSWVECRNPDGLNRDVSEDSFCSCGEQKDG